ALRGTHAERVPYIRVLDAAVGEPSRPHFLRTRFAAFAPHEAKHQARISVTGLDTSMQAEPRPHRRQRGEDLRASDVVAAAWHRLCARERIKQHRLIT